MARLAQLSILLAVGLSAAVAVIPACVDSGYIGSDCLPEWSDRCCPCPSPEACPEGPKPIPWDCPSACFGPPPLPPHCSPDAGVDGDADTTSSLCLDGACVPPGPASWEGPMPFWYGWDIEAPACPDDAPILAFEGQTEPPPPTCSACSCDAPAGTCHLPTTWTLSSAGCSDPGGGVKTNFDPPADWDGTCNQDKAITGGMLCGGVPCVRSITISAPVIEEQPCTAQTNGDPVPPPPRARYGGPEIPIGRACKSDKGAPSCAAETGKVCVSPSPEFKACLLRDGDHACPEGWSDRHLLYGQVEDTRDCAACTCSPPNGGTCQVKYRIFSEPMCSTEVQSGDIWAGMIAPCHDFMPGTQISGKSTEMLAYQPGSCTPSGGDVVGDLVLADAVTVCCYAPVT
jgi:hypothetical protein